MFVIRYKKFFIALSVFFVAIALASLFIFGLPLGIDFRGGSELQFTYTDARPNIEQIKTELTTASFPDITVQPMGTNGVLLKSPTITETERAVIVSTLTHNGERPGVEESFTTIGPSVGRELKHKSIVSVVLVLIAIILFVAYAFRKVSKPVSSWKYGFAVIIALIHDIAIPTGAFALLGHFYGAELDTLFVVALLTTLAISVADTIVVFDRIRENLNTQGSGDFTILVGESLSQTFVRSINTSMMVLIMVLALAIVGPASTRLFAIVLAIGMFFGTYSSIFLASPLLVVFEGWQKQKKK